MPFKKFMEVGRVAYCAKGPAAGNLCVVVDIIDGTRALVDGPHTGVRRQEYKYSHLHLTKFVIKMQHGQHSKYVRKAWDDAEITKKWEESKWARRIVRKKLRGDLGDFDRFKLARAKRTRNALVKDMLFKLKKAAKKDGKYTFEKLE